MLDVLIRTIASIINTRQDEEHAIPDHKNTHVAKCLEYNYDLYLG